MRPLNPQERALYEKAIERETPNQQHYEYLQKEIRRQLEALPETMKWLSYAKQKQLSTELKQVTQELEETNFIIKDAQNKLTNGAEGETKC